MAPLKSAVLIKGLTIPFGKFEIVGMGGAGGSDEGCC